jgi:hypothetical protein
MVSKAKNGGFRFKTQQISSKNFKSFRLTNGTSSEPCLAGVCRLKPFLLLLMLWQNKLECFALTMFSGLDKYS